MTTWGGHGMPCPYGAKNAGETPAQQRRRVETWRGEATALHGRL